LDLEKQSPKEIYSFSIPFISDPQFSADFLSHLSIPGLLISLLDRQKLYWLPDSKIRPLCFAWITSALMSVRGHKTAEALGQGGFARRTMEREILEHRRWSAGIVKGDVLLLRFFVSG
jgi:hypothetical protein